MIHLFSYWPWRPYDTRDLARHRSAAKTIINNKTRNLLFAMFGRFDGTRWIIQFLQDCCVKKSTETKYIGISTRRIYLIKKKNIRNKYLDSLCRWLIVLNCVWLVKQISYITRIVFIINIQCERHHLSIFGRWFYLPDIFVLSDHSGIAVDKNISDYIIDLY